MTPTLRFSDYSDKWQARKLSELSDFQEGPGIMAVDFTNTGVPLIRLSGLTGPKVSLQGCNYLDPVKVNNHWSHFKLRVDDILLSTSATLGTVSEVDYATEGAIAYTGIIRFRPSVDVTKNFLKCLLLSSAFQKQAKSMSTGGTIHHFGPTHLKQMTFSIPGKEEQAKIADFLTAVNEKIAVQDKRLELMKRYKKGVMQKVFTQQIRYRDEEGRAYPTWERRELSKIFTEVVSKVGDTKAETFSITAGSGFVSQKSKFGRDISGQQNSNYTFLRPGEFAYNKGNSKTFRYGCVYANHGDSAIAIPGVFISFRLNDDSMSGNFFEQLFMHHYLDRYLRQIISSGARMDGLLNVSKKDFFDIKIPVPCSDEQQKIATLLSALDSRLKAEGTRLSTLRRFRTALLHGLFT